MSHSASIPRGIDICDASMVEIWYGAVSSCCDGVFLSFFYYLHPNGSSFRGWKHSRQHAGEQVHSGVDVSSSSDYLVISEARVPYCSIRSGVLGSSCSNKAPSLRAATWLVPLSAETLRFFESKWPTPWNKGGASS